LRIEDSLMGPASYAAIGRALSLALATSIFNGKGSVVTLLAKQLEHAIAEHDLSLARMLIQDLSYRHHDAFEEFIKKFGDKLTPEERQELGLE